MLKAQDISMGDFNGEKIQLSCGRYVRENNSFLYRNTRKAKALCELISAVYQQV